MGGNGQQLTIYLPAGTGKVRVAETNQNNQQVIWDGNANPFLRNVATNQEVFLAATLDWWWKGHVDIWYNDSAGTTHQFSVGNVPVSQSDDHAIVVAPGLDPSVVNWQHI